MDDMVDLVPKQLRQAGEESPLWNLPPSELRDLERVWIEEGPEGPADWQQDDVDDGRYYAHEDVGPYHGVNPPAHAAPGPTLCRRGPV